MAGTVHMGLVWDRTVAFLERHRGVLIPIALLGILLPNVGAGLFQAWGAVAAPGPRAALFGLLALLCMIVGLWGELCVVALAAEPLRQRAAVSHASRRLPAVVGVSLVLLVAATVLALPVVAILAVLGFDFAAASAGQTPALSPVAAAWIGLYAVIVLPLLLWIAARLILVTPVVLEERLGLGAIRRSFQLTRGHALPIIGVLLLYAVVYMVATLAARFVFGTIFALVLGGEAPVRLADVLTMVLVGVVATVFTVVQGAFVGKLYLLAARLSDGDAFKQ